MTAISSPHNPRLKELRRLRRRRERERSLRFVAEGEDLVLAARRAGWSMLEGYRAAGAKLGGGLDAHELIEVDSELLAEASTLGSGTRALGVYQQRWSERPAGPLCVYLHGLADPGNVGTVLRAAEAFGASSVALGPGCADPYSPKAVRASMGAIFGVALAHAGTVEDLPGERLALVAHAGRPLPEVDLNTPLTLLVGAERGGLPEEMVAACEYVAHIPIRSESLNAAMAATIALYEMSDWERRGARPKPGDTRLRPESPFGPAGLRPAAPPSRVPPA
jgi:RNA methyltransferase, TrmH family